MIRTRNISYPKFTQPEIELERKPPSKEFIVLTNDPSITAWGWVVLDSQSNILETGCIKTESHKKALRIRKGDDTTRRINEINQELLRVIRKHKVTYLLSELPHGSQNAQAAVMIGITTGVAQTLSDALNIGIEWYSEQDSKKCLLGKRSATKDETIQAIDKLYKVHWTNIKYKDEAVADALSIHYTAKQQSSALKLFAQYPATTKRET